jgi:hypothetical protein
MKLVPILLFILLLCQKVSAQSDTKLNYDTMYTWGYFPLWNMNIECMDSVTTKYGYITRIVGGCTVTDEEFQRWMTHNEIIEAKLTNRFGKNWEEDVEKSLLKCEKK